MIGSWATAQTISYEYDNAGNRTKRKVITLKSAEMASDEDEQPISDSWSEREVTIYPNPTKGNLKIRIHGGDVDNTQYEYAVYNTAGTMLSNGTIDNLGENPISFEVFSPGTYLLILKHEGEQKTYKIIKQ